MSDETKMNHELEKFEASLREVSTPVANVDRDQLMYDAGWAAALSADNSTVSVSSATGTNGSRKLPSILLSFASGLAVATAIMLTFMTPDAGARKTIAVASNDHTQADVDSHHEVSVNNLAQQDSSEDGPDAFDWFNDLPAGRTINSRFGIAKTAAQLPSTDSSPVEITKPATTHQLLREFLPHATARQTTPTFSAWMLP